MESLNKISVKPTKILIWNYSMMDGRPDRMTDGQTEGRNLEVQLENIMAANYVHWA